MPDSHAPEPEKQRDPQRSRERPLPSAPAVAGITVALGAGFSRGFAHLGVLAVLEEEKLPVTAITGTSIGGLLGAAYADGISVRDLCELGRRVRVRDFLRFHPSDEEAWPKRKDCIGRFVSEWFRSEQLEALPIATAIVATDLDTGAPYIFTRGPVETAIRASCAFPGLVKPVRFEGRLLADGCIAAPLPSAIAARLYGGCVLGVSVNASTAGPADDEDRGGLDSSFQVARRRSLEPSWSRRADLLVEPAVHHIDWNDFSRVEDAFLLGADAMRRALPRLRELLSRMPVPGDNPRPSLPAENWLAL